MSNNDIINVEVVTDGQLREGSCGAIIWWSLREGAKLEEFNRRITEVLDPLMPAGKKMPRPRAVSKRAAMHRSLVGVLTNGLYRVLNATQMRSIVVHIGKTDQMLIQPESIWQLRIENDQVVEDLRDRSHINDGLADEFKRTYETTLNLIDVSDLSSWMTDCVDSVLQGISLRKSTGGTYFVPKENMSILRAMKQLLPEFGSQLYMVPAMPSADATEAVLDALNHEVVQTANTIEEELSSFDEKTQTRAFTNRLGKIVDLTERVKKFEGLMGGSLDILRAKLETLQVACTMRQLSASSDSDDDEAAA